MTRFDIYELILPLIQTWREDDYWDFKREHHRNKADLLHDILCMANSLHDKDGYIIIGIDEETRTIVGVENDDFRRNQQCIIDFLRSKKFAGDNRPKIELHIMKIAGHEVDVIVVLNTLKTPYYLRESYKDNDGNGKPRIINANAIYTRVGDTNTPIDQCADYTHVEYLWKKRLGLHLSPFERLCWLLKDKSQWAQGEENHYNKRHPEFTLLFDDTERGTNEFYSYLMTNPSTSYGYARMNYFGTTLYTQQIVYLDSGRFATAVPSWGFIYLDQYRHEMLSFKYYIESDIDYLLHLYLWNEESGEACSARRRFLEASLIFRSEWEKDVFLSYVQSNIDSLRSQVEAKKDDCMRRIRGEGEPAKSKLAEEMATGLTLKTFLHTFRKSDVTGEDLEYEKI